jgi:hypothetical protein
VAGGQRAHAYPAYTGSEHDHAPVAGRPAQLRRHLLPRQTGGFDEPQGENAAQGTFYSAKLQVYVNKDAPDVAEAVARLTGGKYLAAYRDNNGLTKLVGMPEWPLRFSADLETGKKTADRNGYPLTFLGEGAGTLPLLPGGRIHRCPPYPPRLLAGFNFGFS